MIIPRGSKGQSLPPLPIATEPSAWTVDTLHMHMQQQINDLRMLLDERSERQEKSIALAQIVSDKAVAKSEAAQDKRLDSVNEFRGQLADQAATFITRNESESRSNAISEKVSLLTDRNTKVLSELQIQVSGIENRNTGLFMTRSEYEARHVSLSDIVSNLQLQVTELQSRAGVTHEGKTDNYTKAALAIAGSSVLVAIISIVIAVLAHRGG